jgi:endonuclease/exonuclease/phosphatase family metal-dependent hydrolase
MKSTITLIMSIITGVFTLALYLTPDISPELYWYTAFLPFLIPAFWLLNLVFIIIWAFKRSWYIFIPLFAIFFGYKYLERTYSLSFFHERKQEDFKVLSYNVRVFNTYSHLADSGFVSTMKMIRWVTNNNSDIKCFQEFVNYPKDTMLHTIEKIKKNNPYAYCNAFFINPDSFTIGMAIFSKHPIVGSGAIRFREKTNNQAIYADIKIKNDTVRVYNVHLQSMSIDEKDLIGDNTSKSRYVKVLLRYKRGAIIRSRQVDRVIDHIESSPYRVIVCGDFNETPYTYSYEKLNDRFYNAFEEGGKGFGFTYNGLLFFLRIDNIFTDKGIYVNDLTVHRGVPYSDHFPIEASLSLK